MEKQKLRVELESVVDQLSGPISDLPERLLPTLEKWSEKGHSDFELSLYLGYEQCDVMLTGLRDETDDELQKRLAKAAKVEERKLKNKAAKRKLYETLKKEFEA